MSEDKTNTLLACRQKPKRHRIGK